MWVKVWLLLRFDHIFILGRSAYFVCEESSKVGVSQRTLINHPANWLFKNPSFVVVSSNVFGVIYLPGSWPYCISARCPVEDRINLMWCFLRTALSLLCARQSHSEICSCLRVLCWLFQHFKQTLHKSASLWTLLKWNTLHSVGLWHGSGSDWEWKHGLAVGIVFFTSWTALCICTCLFYHDLRLQQYYTRWACRKKEPTKHTWIH